MQGHPVYVARFNNDYITFPQINKKKLFLNCNVEHKLRRKKKHKNIEKLDKEL